MNTAKKFFAVAVWFVAFLPLAAQTSAQPNQPDATAACQQWFFHYPQSDQRGVLLEISHEALVNPANLLPGKEDWLEYVEVPAFRQNFYGRKVAGLTLYYDPCRQLASMAVYNTAEELVSAEAAVARARADQVSAYGAAASNGDIPTRLARLDGRNCDPEISWTTLYRGKSGKPVPFSKLVRERKLTADEASRIGGSESFLNIAEAYGSEFSIRKNTCDGSFRIVPTLVTSRVESNSGQASAEGSQGGASKFNTITRLGGSGAGTYFMIAGNPYGAIIAGAATFAVPLIRDLFRRDKKAPKPETGADRGTEVTSEITYKTAAVQTETSRPAKERKCDPRKEWCKFDGTRASESRDTTFRMSGEWWKNY